MTLTVEALWRIAPTCPVTRAAEFHPLILAAWDEFAIDTPTRQAAWLGQALHESAEFTHVVESLNYRAARLMVVWPKRFPSIISALPYEHKPVALAEHVYGGRMGNGPEGSGDGARYIGRGLIQLTGRDAYDACGAVLGLPLLEHPAMLEQFGPATRSACWRWTSHRLNALADRGAFGDITRNINGGLTGLMSRRAYWRAAKTELGA